MGFSLSACTKSSTTYVDNYMERALLILESMTLEEKVEQMSGGTFEDGNPASMSQRYRIHEDFPVPAMVFTDGPRGTKSMTPFRNTTTVFPVPVLRASAWDVADERRVGNTAAMEVRSLGSYVMLAPCINQTVHPKWGRTQEAFGEDPYLLGVMGQAFVEGIQSQGYAGNDSSGRPIYANAQYFHERRYSQETPNPLDYRSYRVQAVPKHFAVNNWENSRRLMSANIDNRTLREIFLPHFKKAMIDGDSAGVMAAYNQVNSLWASSNPNLLRDIIYDDWGFDGFIMTDWYVQLNSTLMALQAGLCIEMPFSDVVGPNDIYVYGNKLYDYVQANPLAELEFLDPLVTRILYTKVKFGMLDFGRDFLSQSREYIDASAYQTNIGIELDDGRQIALEIARKGMVLLKDGDRSLTGTGTTSILPLDAGAISTNNRIVLIGRYADGDITDTMSPNWGCMPRMGDIGSSNARSSRWVSPTRGIAKYLGDTTLASNSQYPNGRPPLGSNAGVTASNTVYAGRKVQAYTGMNTPLNSPPVIYYSIDGKDQDNVTHNQWVDTQAMTALADDSTGYAIIVCAYVPANLSEIEGGIKARDGTGEQGEAQDKRTSSLRPRDLNNIEAVREIKRTSNPNLKIIVLLNTGSPVPVEDFLADDVDVIIQAWYPGICGGQAIAELLFGKTLNYNMITSLYFTEEGYGESDNIPRDWEGDIASRPISFTGKTPITWPMYDGGLQRLYPGTDEEIDIEDPNDRGQLPYVLTATGSRSITNVNYGYYHGYKFFEKGLSRRVGSPDPRYWFGHGLSYNTYTYSNIQVNPNYDGGRMIRVTVNVTNNGEFEADEVVQAYISFANTQLTTASNLTGDTVFIPGQPAPQWGRPVKQLVAFDRVTVPAGQTRTAEMFINPEDLAYWNDTAVRPDSNRTGRMMLEDINYTVIAASSADPNLPVSLKQESAVFRLHSRWNSWFN